MSYNPSLYRPDFATNFQVVVATSGGLWPILPADPTRVWLALCPQTVHFLAVGFSTDIGSQLAPWVLTSGQTLELFWARHGLMVTLPIYGYITTPLPVGGVHIAVQTMTFQPFI